MVNILLICSAGMSTSALVRKMEEAAAEKGIEAKIWAVGHSQTIDEAPKADIILLGPQLRWAKDQVTNVVQGKIPVVPIDMATYGMMNGKKALEDALAALGK